MKVTQNKPTLLSPVELEAGSKSKKVPAVHFDADPTRKPSGKKIRVGRTNSQFIRLESGNEVMNPNVIHRLMSGVHHSS